MKTPKGTKLAGKELYTVMKLNKKYLLGIPVPVVALAGALAIGGGTALAVTTGGGSATHVQACVVGPARTIQNAYVNGTPNCGKSTPITLGTNGTVSGARGPAGPAGPSGVVSTGVHDLGGKASIPTGGPFSTNKTEIGTIDLAAGTYLVSVTGKATPPVGGTGSVDVFPQFFVYGGAAQADFSNDLFNVGSGALESGTNNQIDSYFSGSGQVVLSTAGTLHFYGFGYDSDRSAASYILDDLSVTVTQVTPAS